jgi:Uma2 family endonuclease
MRSEALSAASVTARLPRPVPVESVYRFTPEQVRQLRATGIIPDNGAMTLLDGLLMTGPSLYRFSIKQYRQMIARGILSEDEPVELLAGWIVTKMPRNPPHDSTVFRTQKALNDVLTDEWICRCQSGTTTDDSQPEPDLAVVRGPEDRYDTRHPAAADAGMFIEASDSTLVRDREFKGSVYAAARIPVYWIVNIPERHVEVHTNPSGPAEEPAYADRRDYGPDDELPVILDGREIARLRVRDLLPRALPAGGTATSP